MNTKARMKTSELVSAVAKHHFVRVTDPSDVSGSQMWNGEWWMPLSGCDTLANMLDDLVYAIERRDGKK